MSRKANVIFHPSDVSEGCPDCRTVFLLALTSMPSLIDLTATSLSTRSTENQGTDSPDGVGSRTPSLMNCVCANQVILRLGYSVQDHFCWLPSKYQNTAPHSVELMSGKFDPCEKCRSPCSPGSAGECHHPERGTNSPGRQRILSGS